MINLTKLKHNPYIRPYIDFLLTPFRLRSIMRSTEIGLIAAAALIGIISAVVVFSISMISQWMHEFIFELQSGEHLSAIAHRLPKSALIAPMAGGVLIGILFWILARWRKKPIVDPIEANALHGGRLSLTDSFILVGQNLISNGFGASVGLEAAHTQLASGFASHFGRYLQLRRADLRLLVGCGAAGAIASVFNAPLTGAFYAFELIIGTYSIAALAPVITSAIVATLLAQAIGVVPFEIKISALKSISAGDYIPAVILGLLCAMLGIIVMRMVTFVESKARASSIPNTVMPLIGGAIVGMLALISPQVLASGHGALSLDIDAETSIFMIVLLFLTKATASAVSIGTGFRGGLFFASLFLGALVGKIFAILIAFIAPFWLTPEIYAIIGMSALGVAIIGGPLTMTFLALEVTGSFSIAMIVLAAVLTSSVVVRKTFGYSFATWRFHLRGETIRSAHDIGWIRDLTVQRLMRADVKTVNIGMDLSQFKKEFPLGSTQRVIAVDDLNRYVGMIYIADVHAGSFDDTSDEKTLRDFIQLKQDYLLPNMNAKEAAARFDRSETEALAVVNNAHERQVIGLLTETHTLRRYSEELDRRRRELAGEV